MNLRNLTTALILLALVGVAGRLSAAEPAETEAQREARMKWWREARFGMFIHWGVYSVPAGFYQGKPVAGIGEWIMNRGKIPVAEYKQFAKQFNPVKFDADAWVRLAKAAGMRYMVITSKHHDGFAMFHTKVDDWNIVTGTPFGRDPLAELAAACKKHDMRLGFYYSQAQDWCHPGGAASGGHWDKAQEGDMDKYLREVAVPQVREILSNYGPVAVLWWDTPTNMTKERAELLLPLLKLQPHLMTNNRLGGGYAGDTETPEQFIPATGFPGRDWETCMTMNNTWGYKSDDENWKSVETIIRNLVDIASKGGNYLLNVGPTSEGLIPQPSVERLETVGKWMQTNGEAIYATSASPFKRLAWGRVTKKSEGDRTTLYLHVFDWPRDGRLVVPGLKTKAVAARLLVDRQGALELKREGDDVVIALPAQAPDAICSVVVLSTEGPLEVIPQLLTQAADGSISLPAFEAITHGTKVKYESGHRKDNVGYWLDPSDWVEWKFKVSQPGTFDISTQIAAMGPARFELVVGDKRLAAQSPKTGDYTKFQPVKLGRIELPAGEVSLAVKPIKQGWTPINLKSLALKPVK